MKSNLLKKCILSQFIIVAFLFLIIGSSWAVTLPLPVTIKIDSTQTYLVPDVFIPIGSIVPDPENQSPKMIELSAYGINQGDVIRLERLGDFTLHPDITEDFDVMIGVFSTSNTILPLPNVPFPTLLPNPPNPDPDPLLHNFNRVFGAIEAGDDILTEVNHFSHIKTDIEEDFLIGGNFTNWNGIDWAIDEITITVPIKAQYLWVAAFDNHWEDNIDVNGDFAVRISMVEPIPEPATIALLGIGLAGLAGVGARRKWKRKV